MTPEQQERLLVAALVKVCMYETLKDYDNRNVAIIAALHHALEMGLDAGIRLDPKEPDYPVVFIELEDVGQVSWHIAQYPRAWDGHDTDEKYQRVSYFLSDKVG